MSFEVTGKLEKYLELQEGNTKAGEVWKKQAFLVKTDESFNNLYCFELFAKGEHLTKIENLLKYNKIGDDVKVSFNVSANEYNGKYYTSLSAWRVENSKTQKDKGGSTWMVENNDGGSSGAGDDLPF